MRSEAGRLCCVRRLQYDIVIDDQCECLAGIEGGKGRHTCPDDKGGEEVQCCIDQGGQNRQGRAEDYDNNLENEEDGVRSEVKIDGSRDSGITTVGIVFGLEERDGFDFILAFEKGCFFGGIELVDILGPFYPVSRVGWCRLVASILL